MKSQDESVGGEQRNNQKTKTMTTKKMKRRSHLPKAMAKNTTISKRPRWGWPGRWEEVHKTKAMVENTTTTRKLKRQQPRGWKKD